MTISSQVGRKQYNGDGVSVAFPTEFKFFDSDDLLVIRRSAAGVDTTLVESVDYSVSGGDPSGTVTTAVAPASGEKLTIILDPDLLQDTDYVSNDSFPAESHERALDRVTQQNIRTRDLLARALRAPDGDVSPLVVLPVALARAQKFLFFDANGDLQLVSAIDGTIGTGDFVRLSTPNDFTNAGQQIQGNDIFHEGNDGPGSGLDADTVDGVQLAGLAQLATGSFTATLTGMTGSVQGTVFYRKVGGIVTLYSSTQIQGTSNTSACAMTGLPAAVQPSVHISAPCDLTNNGSSVPGYGIISAGVPNVLTFKVGTTLSSIGFTTSGFKGLTEGWSISYPTL